MVRADPRRGCACRPELDLERRATPRIAITDLVHRRGCQGTCCTRCSRSGSPRSGTSRHESDRSTAVIGPSATPVGRVDATGGRGTLRLLLRRDPPASAAVNCTRLSRCATSTSSQAPTSTASERRSLPAWRPPRVPSSGRDVWLEGFRTEAQAKVAISERSQAPSPPAARHARPAPETSCPTRREPTAMSGLVRALVASSRPIRWR